MEWFTLWLKKIILLVLLAAFLDLILPNTSLQRYVKMVMGLIILLTIMSPVFTLFRIPPEELALRLSSYQQEFEARDEPNPQWESLSKKLMQQQDEQMERYVSGQMESLIRQQVLSAYGIEVSSVDVRFRQSGESTPDIEAITVVVSEDKGGEQKSPEKEDPVRPIRPIEIEVGSESQSKEFDSVPVSGQQHTALYREIAAQVAQDWQVAPDQVRVISAKENETG
ncbi:stage III sporulation protein AF [Brevibacillus humidisoli]|uniref:stage III sporulation protein AF n=1 Tax=Brevibacillus humidisoli TaxID=2895522 RepID=UPI001E439541|nr:stage III sporulation protein AF [Brevibacillus humidisoli]UFJ42919.1 stage III sporulation protein AF [Brevibacillus humidisoli]